MMIIYGSITFVLAEIIGKLAGIVYSNNQPLDKLSNVVNHLIGHAVDNSFYFVRFSFFLKQDQEYYGLY